LLASGTASGSAGHQGDGEDFARRLTKVRTPWRFSSFHPPGPTIAQVSAATAESPRGQNPTLLDRALAEFPLLGRTGRAGMAGMM